MKNVKWIFLASGLIALISFGVTIFSVIQETDWSQVRAMNIPRMLETGEFLPIPILIVVMGIVFATLFHFYRIIVPPTIKNGVTARAKVLKVWDTGTTINDNPQIGMLVEVSPSMGSVFQAEAKTIVSRLNAALVQPGIAAKVVYDPGNLKRIQVLEVDVGSTAPSNAVARMEELEQLHDRRLITEAEYQEKRKQILGKL
jgi:hypothetical protein